MKPLGVACAVAYVATVWLANWLVQHYGLVSVGFGYYAPAGVYAAGLALTLRDVTQRLLGRAVVVACILAGAGLAYLVSPRLAFASAVAFLVSEALDLAVYTPLEERGWLRAVALSNAVGLVADSVLFLWLAFGSLAFLPGQIIGKTVMTLAAVTVLAVVRPRLATPVVVLATPNPTKETTP